MRLFRQGGRLIGGLALLHVANGCFVAPSEHSTRRAGARLDRSQGRHAPLGAWLRQCAALPARASCREEATCDAAASMVQQLHLRGGGKDINGKEINGKDMHNWVMKQVIEIDMCNHMVAPTPSYMAHRCMQCDMYVIMHVCICTCMYTCLGMLATCSNVFLNVCTWYVRGWTGVGVFNCMWVGICKDTGDYAGGE